MFAKDARLAFKGFDVGNLNDVLRQSVDIFFHLFNKNYSFL